MKITLRLILKLTALTVIALTGITIIDNLYSVAANNLAIDSVNGGDIEYLAQKSSHNIITTIHYAWGLVMGLLSFLTVKKELKKN